MTNKKWKSKKKILTTPKSARPAPRFVNKGAGLNLPAWKKCMN